MRNMHKLSPLTLTIALAGLGLAGCSGRPADHRQHQAGSAVVAAHQDHAGKQGGLVQMFGDLHTEVVIDHAGRHRLYVSDATRQPLPPSAISGVTFTVKRPGQPPEQLTLQAGSDHWFATGRPVHEPKTMVRLAFVHHAQPQFIDVPALVLAQH